MLKSIIFLSTILISISVYADFTGKVVKVTDGDTINVLEAGNILHKVRLTGIDAPERG
ncbi:thermonuclease family protein [Porticoccus sp.]